MMEFVKPRYRTNRRNAFSLIEVVTAIGVLGLCLLILMALLSQNTAHVGELVDDDEMHRMISTLDTSLQNEGLAAVYSWVQEGQKLRIYPYAADPLQNVGTGAAAAPKPLPNAVATGTVGQNYIIVTGVRAENDPLLAADLQAVTGQQFQVILNVSPYNVLPYTSTASLPAQLTAYTDTRLVLTVTLQRVNDPAGPTFTFTTMVLR
jgi:hypothetical protein